MEGDVAEDFRTHPVSEAYILEADHLTTLWATLRQSCPTLESTLLFRLGMPAVPEFGPSDGVVNGGLILLKSAGARRELVAKR